jgi:hypothetical protein
MIKKWSTITITLLVVFVLMVGGTWAEETVVLTDADHEVDYPAAPAIAAQLLEDAGVDNRYGTGKDGGNYIRDVAEHMGPETDFDGVSKENEVMYVCAVAKFLLGKDVGITNPYSGVLDPAASGATATDNADGSVTLVITVKDLCGDSISELNPLVDFYVKDSVIPGTFYFGTGSIPGSTDWAVGDGVYTVELQRNFFNARPAGYENGWYRIWDIYVLDQLVEEGLQLQTTYYAVGDWKMDLYVGTTLHQRFITIDTHIDGDIEGFLGIGYDPEGAPTGNITGYIAGQVIYMLYDRVGFDDPTYTAVFWGTIANDGNSMSGTWSDYARTDEPWDMVRH